jgi:hypothetical protein
MTRRANHSDKDLDHRIAGFLEREGRKPTYKEIKEMCPLGVSNDRISSAFARAENQTSNESGSDDPGAMAPPLTALKAFTSSIDGLLQEVQELQAENSKLRASQQSILAQHSLDIAKAVADVRRESQEKLNAVMRAILTAKSEE